MAANCTNIGVSTNPNFLHPNKFQLNFSRMPNLQYSCQGVSVPGVSMGEALQTTPFVDLYAPGDKIVYDLLNVTFYIDENLQSWKEIHDWIRAMTFPEDFEDYLKLGELNNFTKSLSVNKTQYSEGILTLLTSSNNPKIRFKFYDLFPISVSTFIMSATDSPETILTADATFRYSYFNIETVA